MVLAQKWPLFQVCFLQNIVPEKFFYGIVQRKNAVVGYENKKFKSRKLDIFPKWLTDGFGPKMAILSNLFFQAISARKMSLTIFQKKKKPFQVIETRSSKSRNIGIFPMGLNHGFGPKKAIFYNFFFQAIQARKMSITILQNEKTPFQAKKTKTSKSRKTDIFPKGLTHGFRPKMAIFPNFFFLGNIGQENVFYHILQRKNCFLGYKNKKFKKSKY